MKISINIDTGNIVKSVTNKAKKAKEGVQNMDIKKTLNAAKETASNAVDRITETAEIAKEKAKAVIRSQRKYALAKKHDVELPNADVSLIEYKLGLHNLDVDSLHIVIYIRHVAETATNPEVKREAMLDCRFLDKDMIDWYCREVTNS